MPFRRVSTCIRCAAGAGRRELDLGRHQKLVAKPRADAFGEPLDLCAGREFDVNRQRRLLPHALGARADHDHARDRGGEFVDHLADGGGKDIDPAHDQHVVGAADAADARRRAPAGARAHAHPHMVAGAEAQQRRRAVDEVGQHELALGPVFDRLRRAGLRIDQLDMDKAPAAKNACRLFARIRPREKRKCRRCPSPR